MDAAGKDSVIKHVMSGVNPQGVQVSRSRALRRGARPRFPLAHRESRCPSGAHRHLQPLALRGGRRAEGAPRIARAPELPPGIAASVLAGALRGHQQFRAPPRRNGTKVVKFFLHVSKEVQKERFLARLEDPVRTGSSTGRRRRAGVLRRLHRRVRRRADRHVHPMGAVVRDPGGPLVGHAGDRGLGARGEAEIPGLALAGGLGRGACRQPRGPQGARGRARRPLIEKFSLARLGMFWTSEPTSSTTPMKSCPIPAPGSNWANPAPVVPEVGAAHAGEHHPDDRVGRLGDRRNRDDRRPRSSMGPLKMAARMAVTKAAVSRECQLACRTCRSDPAPASS